MSIKRKPFVQKGECDFIDAVVKAVLKNDVSKEHFLVDADGIMRYACFVVDPAKPIANIIYEIGDQARVVCVISKELIEDFHYKAGDDDLAKPWAKKAVKYVIEHGKKLLKECTLTMRKIDFKDCLVPFRMALSIKIFNGGQ